MSSGVVTRQSLRVNTRGNVIAKTIHTIDNDFTPTRALTLSGIRSPPRCPKTTIHIVYPSRCNEHDIWSHLMVYFRSEVSPNSFRHANKICASCSTKLKHVINYYQWYDVDILFSIYHRIYYYAKISRC